MTDAPFNAAEIGIELGTALEKAGLPYALGGALALGVWALPRATKDVDLNLFVPPGIPSPRSIINTRPVIIGGAYGLLEYEVVFDRPGWSQELSHGGAAPSAVGNLRASKFSRDCCSIPYLVHVSGISSIHAGGLSIVP